MPPPIARKGHTMPLRPGDEVSLTASPTIALGEFQFLKPGATVKRVLSDDVEGDLEQIQQDLRHVLDRSCLVELHALNDYVEALNEGSVEALADYCLKEIGHGNQGQPVESEDAESTRPRKRKKAASKKAARRRGKG